MKKYIKKLVSLVMSGMILSSIFSGISVEKVYAATDSVKAVSAGGYHSAAIRADGSLWMWGNNESGQIGDGTKTDRKLPKKIMDNAKIVALGYEHSAAIKTDGSLWMWGDNGSGQIGNGTTTDCKQPQKIMEDVKAVALGREHSAAIKTDGSLWMWGDNYVAQLGDGSMTNRLKPRKVMDNVKTVALGEYHSAAIKTDGSLWMWGRNRYGEIGDGSTEERTSPWKVMNNVKAVELGEFHSAAIKTDGSLWMWGLNWYGQLGDGTMTDRSQPKQIMTNVEEVAVGENHTAAIKTNGSLWVWGSSLTVQNTNTQPEQIMTDVEKVAVGENHTAAIKTDGSLWTWGRNLYGQIGDGTTTERTSPKKIKLGVLEQKITASSKTVTIGASAFNINVKASGGGILSYKSGNTKVATVSSTGKITVKSCGKATITITAAAKGNYLKATKKITITVVPKKEQKITASSKTVTRNASTFSINAKASGGGKLSYKSGNTKVVTVSSAGKITVKGYGKATITITAASTSKYKKATKKITVKVIPKKVSWDSVKATGSGRIKIDWKKQSVVSGYKCQISLSSKFSTNKKYQTREKIYSKSVKVPFEVKGLSKGKTYYVRVRSYKTVNGTKYYGAWSTVKKVKVK